MFNLICHFHCLVLHEMILYVADLNDLNDISNLRKGLKAAFSNKYCRMIRNN